MSKRRKALLHGLALSCRLCCQKKKNYLRFICTKKTSHTKEAFTKIRNYYFLCVRIKKQEYYRTKFAKYKSDIRSTWRSINFLLGKAKSNECSSLKIQDNLINDPAEIANNFNDHFAILLLLILLAPSLTPTSVIT